MKENLNSLERKSWKYNFVIYDMLVELSEEVDAPTFPESVNNTIN